MRIWPPALIALSTVLTVLTGLTAAPAAAQSLVDHTQWVQWAGKSSLRVYPTAAGRSASGEGSSDAAWSQVLILAPDADTPGMRAQFDCHWQWAEFAEPGKPSWNLEPWRPVVDDAAMAAAGCNPGDVEAGVPPAGGGAF